LEIQGATFCVAEPDFMIDLHVNMQIAVAGSVAPRNENHIESVDGHMFEVEDGRVMSNRHKHFEKESEALADLRNALSQQ
jgi:hypothetical protein